MNATTTTGLWASLDARVTAARARLRTATVGRPGWSGRAWRVGAWIAYRDWMFTRTLAVWAGKHPLPVLLGVLLAVGWWGTLTLAEVPGDRTTGPVLLLLVFLSPGLFLGLWAAITPGRYKRVMHARAMGDAWPKVAESCGLSARRPDGTITISRLRHVRHAPGAVVLRIETFAGQTPDTLHRAAPAITTAFRAHGYETTAVKPGVLDLALFTTYRIAPATARMPEPERANPDSLPVGRTRAGQIANLVVRGRHTLVVGATGAGKGSALWSVVGNLAPAVHDGTARLWGLDLKGGVELEMGRALFGHVAYSSEDAIPVLRALLRVIDQRKESMRGRSRLHVPTPGDPLHMLVVDELADLMAYSEFEIRREADRLMSKILTQGRALGVVVLACVQNPRQEAVGQRNLYPQKVALRLDSDIETDMVLGPQARLAPAHEISQDEPGTAYIVGEDGAASMARFDYWPDDVIRAVALRYAAPSDHTAPAPRSGQDAVNAWADAAAARRGAVNENEPVKPDNEDAPAPRQRKPRAPRKPRTPRAPRPAAPAASTEEA
ncbi:FtsK/SpoIIIE domain-containing protein [Promicromonospora panici]|uniref:FtsK/SpoIIIE domain-containing protein n=1 Tax=Promicromonospora panici TaxID=2219658 RepID=UPI00101BAEAD|nr:FtsK/SpoIIIE domain-containing protein [Promicromonospora panici]